MGMKSTHEPEGPYPALPENPDDLLPFVPPPPYKMAGAIDAEDLIAGATATNGEISEQGMESFVHDLKKIQANSKHLLWYIGGTPSSEPTES